MSGSAPSTAGWRCFSLMKGKKQMSEKNEKRNEQGRRDLAGYIFGAGFLLCAVVALITVFRGTSADVPPGRSGSPAGGPGIAVVDIRGVISVTRSGGFGGRSRGVARIVERIRKLGESSAVKGLVLRIDSPGGAVAASQELYNAVRRFRKTGKPVVASFGDVAASGGYYAACAADRIVANPGTTTGSIGVIMVAPDMKGLYDWVKIRWNVIKSGRFKDILSPYRRMTAAERAYLKQMVMDSYRQFFDAVHKGRKITKGRLATLAQGQVFTGRQALKHGLVDELGDLEHALLLAGRLARISGRPRVIRIRTRPSLGDLLGSLTGLSPKVTLLPDRAVSSRPAWGPGVYYLYRGY